MSRRIVFLLVVTGILVLDACGGGGGGSSNGSGGGGGTVSGPPLVITTTTAADGVFGSSYSLQLAATGGVQPYTWSLGTSLPPGWTLSNTGLIAGVSTYTSITVTVSVQDSGVPRQSTSQQIVMKFYPKLTITTTDVPGGHTNVPYDFVIQSENVSNWAISSGALPPGVQLRAPSATQVEIQGTPTQIGSFPFTLQATSGSNPPQTASQSYTLVVDDNPAILNSQLQDAVLNNSYQQTLSAANGTPPYHWSLQNGSLPNGITLNSDTGVLSGKFTGDSGTYYPTFQVADSSTPAKMGTRAFSLVGVLPLTIVSFAQWTGIIDQQFYGYLSIVGGRTPMQWTVTGGSLPPGIALIASGQLSGRPTQLGTYNFTLHVVDSTNPAQSADKDFTMKVTPPTLLTSNSLPTRIPQNVAFSGYISAYGGTPPYKWEISDGSVPAGLQLNSSTGELSGKPTDLGTYTFTVLVTDSGSVVQTAAHTFTLTVTPALGRNDSIQKATQLGNGIHYASLSPYADPADTANPDVDYYKITVTKGIEAVISTYAKQAISTNPIDTVLELVDANGVQLNACNLPGQSDGTFTSPCLNDDIQSGVVQDSKLSIKMPGTAGEQTVIYARISDWRGDARPDMTYDLNVSGAVDPLYFPASTTLAPALTGTNYSAHSFALGGVEPITFTLTGGSLPPGLAMTSTGDISGTPTTAGTYSFLVKVMDSGNPAQSTTSEWTIHVYDPIKIVTSPVLPDACTGVPYSFTMQRTGGILPDVWYVYSDGISPTGIHFDTSNGIWSGTATTTGTFSAQVIASDAFMHGDYQTVSLTVKTCP